MQKVDCSRTRLRHLVCAVAATGSQSSQLLAPGHATFKAGNRSPCVHTDRGTQTLTLWIPPVTSLIINFAQSQEASPLHTITKPAPLSV